MNPIKIEVSEVIDARPEAIYAVISDYRVGHLAILPKPYFVDMTVEKGGQGAGTVASVKMEVYGTKKTYNMIVTEPEPGRVIAETDNEAGIYTTFTIDPVNSGNKARITISTRMRPSAGVAGLVERLFNPSVTRRIYRKELKNLANYVRAAR